MFAGFMSLEPALRPDAAVDPAEWRAALAPYHQPDRAGFWQSGPACLFEQRVFNGPATRDEQVPLVCPESGVALAFWGRLDNKAELATALAIDELALAAMTDAELVLAAWRGWGGVLPERLLGDFALAVVDPLHEQVFLARDPFGVKPLYYLLDPRRLAFATSVAALRRLKDVPLTRDPDWMARYVLHLSMNDRRTSYREIVKLPPGHCLTVGADGREQLRGWHTWRDDAPPARRRDPHWVADYRAVLEEAIRCRMAGDYPLGTENSGGLDSASITAYLAHFLGEPGDRLHSFGFALADLEPWFILETSRARRIAHNHIVTGRGGPADMEERLERGLRVLGYPQEHGNGTGHIPFYQECELHGIRTLFSGFGGDEVATHSGGQLRWELLDAGQYDALWRILRGNVVTRTLRLGKAATVGRRKPDYNPRFLAAWNARWPYQILRPEVVERLDLHAEYMETARYDAPYRRINEFILEHTLSEPYIATRLEDCTLVAASYGVDYRWPLLDVRLVQQYLSTPSVEKMGPKGIGRYLHRRAVAGVVPPRVAWKPSKDMGSARRRRETGDASMAQVADHARQLEAQLHPGLDDLIDRPKLREQIGRAAHSRGDDEFAFSFQRSFGALRWLDRWLKDEPAV